MGPTLLKAILLGVMFVVALIFGLIPIQLMKRLTSGVTGHPVLSDRASLIISLISCFAGGVFLAVCFLDILPDAMDTMTSIKAATGFSSDYPLVPLIFCLGFFLVYIFEEVSGMLCGKEYEDEDDGQCKHERDRAATFHSIVNSDLVIIGKSHAKENKFIKSLTFVTAFLFHAGLEGFAFGVQGTTISITSLFFGIIVHKAVVLFSIGLRLTQNHPNQPWLVVALVFSVSIIAPIGGIIGIVVEDSDMNSTTKDIVTAILLSIALGTFIYITFFEILAPEHANKYSNLAQWLASFVGFTIIACLMLVG